jgi:S-DNA-T family DNA segregation ATPase FtsK/SpoIIIE
MLNREVVSLAKRNKKGASFAAGLKYEIYGILLITISVIAFYGEGRGAWALTSLSTILLGKFYFMLALIGIWVGLFVMIKRQWPRGWTPRRTGFLLFCLACTLSSTISFAQSRLDPIGSVTSPNIMGSMWTALREQVLQPVAPDPAFLPEEDGEPAAALKPWEKDVGGGMIGAFQYSIFYWMFGYYGSKFIMYIQFAISLLLLVNRSYVDIVRSLRRFIKRAFPKIAARFSAGRKLLAVKAIPVSPGKKSGKRPKTEPVPPDAEDLAGAAEEPAFMTGQRKTPLFFQLFHGKPERESDPHDDEHWEAEGNGRTRDEQEAGHPHEETPAHGDLKSASAPYAEEPASFAPKFTDFAEQAKEFSGARDDLVHKENRSLEDEAEPAYASDMASSESAELSGPAAKNEEGSSPASSRHGGSPTEGSPPKKPKPYKLPPLSLLDKPKGSGKAGNRSDYLETARKLEATLESFGVRAKVLDVARGPAVTRYELQPDVGVKVSRIVSLTDDIALALAAKDIRMEAPIPGKSAIGIEVPNSEVSIVTLREVLETQAFQEAPSKLTVAFGRDISGQPIIGNLAKMPHLLVAGATGSGKSVCINGIITSLLYKAKPDEVKFLMIDPKMVELNVYNGIPHLLAPVVTDPRRASLALKKIVVEMEKRYELFSKSATRNIEGYNALMMSGSNPEAVLPYIVVIVDELADLMMVAAGDVEDSIARLAQMARAAGIHLIIATQRPSVDVITGVIKANIPSRIAFGVSSQVDSRTILDMAGAEKLLGRGDMLFLPMGASKPIRVQGAFLSDSEVEAVVKYVSSQGQAEYNEELVPEVDEAEPEAGDEYVDELFDQAVQIVLEAKQASVSLLQRRMRIGYTRAARLIDAMEAKGIVGPYEGSKPREVLMSLEQYQQRIPS